MKYFAQKMDRIFLFSCFPQLFHKIITRLSCSRRATILTTSGVNILDTRSKLNKLDMLGSCDQVPQDGRVWITCIGPMAAS